MPRSRITCADGYSLSVQVGDSLYCTPRDHTGPYSHVEVGFVENLAGNVVDLGEEWYQYSDTGKPGISDVYGYVPVRLVNEFINAHGGRIDWS